MNVHEITRQFEKVVANYTGAPFAVAVDNCCNALYLSLRWWNEKINIDYKLNNGCFGSISFRNKLIHIPERTYPGVPCEIINAGLNVSFTPVEGESIKGEYQMYPSNVWDSALTFRAGMYRPGQIQCLSFTGHKKILKLSKGGMILTDDESAYKWFKKMRFSGRGECSYHDDDFDKDGIIGRNCYMMPELAARGLLLMVEMPQHNEDVEVRYPNLSKFKCYTK